MHPFTAGMLSTASRKRVPRYFTPPEITVTCLEECRVTILPKNVFLGVLARRPEMYFAVIKVLSADLATADRLRRECARGFQPKSVSSVRPL